jgi:DNA-binding winged helix-turn-helix (wHTH) protein
MSPSPKPVSAYAFGEFRLKVQDRILERHGVRVLLTPKVVDILFVLIENAGQLVTKDSLIKAVWPDVTVVESGLTRNISVLRKALDEDSPEGLYIETIPRRGYRFIASVMQHCETDPMPPPEIDGLSANTGGSNATASTNVNKRGLRWLAITFLVPVALAWPFFRLTRFTANQPVEPNVRIGEHLRYMLAPEQAVRALDQFEQALSATPNSAAAHAGLSIALLQMPLLGMRSLSEVAEARRLPPNERWN